MFRAAPPNSREAIDDHAATWYDVTSNAENAVAVGQPLDQRHLAAEAVVGAVEASHVRRRELAAAKAVEQIGKSAKESEPHPSAYSSPH